jgi:hypothetical protein
MVAVASRLVIFILPMSRSQTRVRMQLCYASTSQRVSGLKSWNKFFPPIRCLVSQVSMNTMHPN